MTTVSPLRPRIWVTPASLGILKARAAKPTSRWLTVKQWADKPADWNISIYVPALAYLVTGNKDYAAKAFSLMQQSMQAGVNQVTPDSGYQSRNFFPAAAVCYDWLNDWLGDDQKTQLRTSIEQCADWVWPETNPPRKGLWAVDDGGNNYFYGFLLTWLAGLALMGDSPKSQGYLDNARNKWNTLSLPQLQGPAAGGCWNEGSGYGTVSTMELLQSLLAHGSATGEDLVTATPWFTDAVTAMIHLTNPPMTEMAPFGDLGSGPINDGHRKVMLMMAGHDSRCKTWLDSVKPSICQQVLNSWTEFLWYPE